MCGVVGGWGGGGHPPPKKKKKKTTAVFVRRVQLRAEHLEAMDRDRELAARQQDLMEQRRLMVRGWRGTAPLPSRLACCFFILVFLLLPAPSSFRLLRLFCLFVPTALSCCRVFLLCVLFPRAPNLPFNFLPPRLCVVTSLFSRRLALPPYRLAPSSPGARPDPAGRGAEARATAPELRRRGDQRGPRQGGDDERGKVGTWVVGRSEGGR